MNNRHQSTNRLAVIVRAALPCAIIVISFASIVSAQDRVLLGQFIQAGSASSPSLMVFRQGRELIAREEWSDAESKFNDFIKEYPSEKNIDAAWYWLAFSLKHQAKYQESDSALERLIMFYPKSNWINDARAMRAEIAPQLGVRGLRIMQESAASDSDEVKILALQSLMTLDQQRGIEVATNILKPGTASSPRLKGAAIFLLGRYGGKSALPVLSGLARNETDPVLRRRAISALGGIDDDAVLDPLKEQAMSAKDSSIIQSTIAAIARNNSPRALSVLSEIAENSQLSSTTRKYAIAYISRRKGEPSVDELLKIYDSNAPNDIKRQVIAGFAVRKSPRAQERLIQIARTSEQPEFRLAAVRSLVSRGDGPSAVLDTVLPLYDAEKDPQVKAEILEVLSTSNDKRAQEKMMEVAKNSSTPVDLRKAAIRSLGRSKDPEVLKFLEALLQ